MTRTAFPVRYRLVGLLTTGSIVAVLILALGGAAELALIGPTDAVALFEGVNLCFARQRCGNRIESLTQHFATQTVEFEMEHF